MKAETYDNYPSSLSKINLKIPIKLKDGKSCSNLNQKRTSPIRFTGKITTILDQSILRKEFQFKTQNKINLKQKEENENKNTNSFNTEISKSKLKDNSKNS